MRKLFISLILVVVCFSLNAQPKKVIKTNPIALAFGGFNATYEKVLNSSSSVLISGSYTFKLLGLNVNAVGLGAGYRYYFTHENKEVPSGFYVTPQAGLSFGSAKTVTQQQQQQHKTSFSTFGIGAEVGYQWAWPSGFALDLGIGPMYQFVMGKSTGSFSKTNGFFPSMTIAIGYAF